MSDKDADQLSDEETKRRLERALKRSLRTPPKPIMRKKEVDDRSRKGDDSGSH
ncbi:MAG: flagellar basal body-associated FliL family protein [Alphaproteobacteria bacterium]